MTLAQIHIALGTHGKRLLPKIINRHGFLRMLFHLFFKKNSFQGFFPAYVPGTFKSFFFGLDFP